MARRKVSLAPEGRWIVRGSLLIVIIVSAIHLQTETNLLWLVVVSLLWLVAVLQFFRDPQRFTPDGNNLIISPADGRIIYTGDASDGPLKPMGKKISIFMSPFNVHVNRSPYSGTVESAIHRNGRFLSAFKETASRENEQVEVVINTDIGRMAFRQVAGFLARRIVFHPKPGDALITGERVGMIRFGSRMDVFLPGNVELKAAIGDRVAAGESIIGEVT